MSNIGSSKIAEMYVGSSKIAQAYLGSILVFQLPSDGYDFYVIHLTWGSDDNLNLAGLLIDGVQPSTSDVTIQWHSVGSWNTVSSSEVESAIKWDNNDQGRSFYCDGINITFTNDSIPSIVKVKTGRWYGGGSMTVTMHVAGVKDGIETDLGYTSQTNAANLMYTVHI